MERIEFSKITFDIELDVFCFAFTIVCFLLNAEGPELWK